MVVRAVAATVAALAFVALVVLVLVEVVVTIISTCTSARPAHKDWPSVCRCKARNGQEPSLRWEPGP